ncbi:Rhamnogalacturonan endolyase [Forsythia ovata]|uniref:Rhamnogalacturonan endolyase n=1 Tax=Forsythia ovata TaxID=205694 RepID=A0ABD1U747_9LAMI
MPTKLAYVGLASLENLGSWQEKTKVRINNSNAPRPDFTTKHIGKDNAIARQQIHRFYLLYSINIRGIQLVNGTNTIYLKQSRGGCPLIGVMYDYICLERPLLAKFRYAGLGFCVVQCYRVPPFSERHQQLHALAGSLLMVGPAGLA